MAGYSGTPLVKKLGIKERHAIALLNAPADFDKTLGSTDLPEGVSTTSSLSKKGELDVILLFVKTRADLEAKFSKAAERLVSNGALWISWPKKSSKVATELTEDVVREIGLAAGLVDNKVCAIDETWSGLRFVVRLADRPKKSTRAQRRRDG